MALTGTGRGQRVGAWTPRLAQVEVRFGEPMDFSHYEGMESSALIRRAVTDEVMTAILRLSDQEYVDSYHPRPAQGDVA